MYNMYVVECTCIFRYVTAVDASHVSDASGKEAEDLCEHESENDDDNTSLTHSIREGMFDTSAKASTYVCVCERRGGEKK